MNFYFSHILHRFVDQSQYLFYETLNEQTPTFEDPNRHRRGKMVIMQISGQLLCEILQEY